jgi:O-antigen ligase
MALSIKDHNYSFNTALTALLGGTLSIGTIAITGLPSKWMIFSICTLICICLLPIVRNKEHFFLYAFFFTLPIGLNYHPIYFDLDVYLPIKGIAIYLYDIFIFFLLGAWLFRILTDSDEKIYFFPWISIPYLLILILATAGVYRSSIPTIIKLSCLLKNLEWWLILLYLANNLNKSDTVHTVVAILLSTILFQSIVGFAQHFAGGNIGLGALFGETAGTFKEARAGANIISRVGGTLGSPNTLALYLGWNLPISLSLLFAPIKRSYKLLLVLPVFLMGAVLEILTFSRGGWLSLGIGGGISLYWCVLKKVKLKIVTFTLVVGFLTIFLLTSLILVNPIRERLFEDDYGAAKTRIPLMRVALNMISHNPLLGVGLANYTSVADHYDFTSEPINVSFPWPVHNEFLLVGAELGLPALGLFMIILYYVAATLLKNGRSRADPVLPYVAIGLFGGFITWCVHVQFEFTYGFISVPIIWTYVGLALGLDRIVESRERQNTPYGSDSK